MDLTSSAIYADSELLARAIAEAFNDTAQLDLYRHYCEKYPPALIQKAFSAAQDYPAERIKKSRQALFFYFINRYGKTSNH